MAGEQGEGGGQKTAGEGSLMDLVIKRGLMGRPFREVLLGLSNLELDADAKAKLQADYFIATRDVDLISVRGEE